MSKEAQLPDGTILEFPDDTPDAVMDRAVKQHIMQSRPMAERYAAAGIDPNGANPTDGMSGFDKFMAGIGKSVYDTGRGVKQLAGDAFNSTADLSNLITGKSKADERRADVDRQRQLDAPLMNTGAGLAGNITGTVGQIVAPGGVAKLGTMVPQIAALPRVVAGLQAIKAASLPNTIKGTALQGGLLGLIQPRGEGDSLGMNVAVSGLLGAAGAAIPRIPGAVSSLAARVMPAFNEGRQATAAGRVIDQFAQNPSAVRAAAANPATIVPGSLPTLAEASGDIGLAGLQRTLANTPEFANALAMRGQANNLARVQHIEGAFGGADSAAADAVRATRDQAARRALKPIDELPMATLSKVVAGVNRIADKHKASVGVRTAMDALKAELPNIRTVRDAHDVRQYIGQLIGGQVEGKAGAKLAARELATVRNLLDREMRAAYPDWGKFLLNHKAMSRQADQIDVGQALLDTGRAVRGATNEPSLTPAAFGRAAGNMDRTVQRATGFSKATAARTLTEPQAGAVDAVRLDLERYSRAMTDGKAIGSNTMQNAVGGNRLQDAVGPVGATMIEPASGVAMLAINQARKVYGERVGAIVQEAMLDPSRAAEILARVPPKSRSAVLRIAGPAVARLSAAAGVSAVPMAQRNQSPLELDIVGGRPIPADEAQRLYGQ